jgi:hypothetical protein
LPSGPGADRASRYAAHHTPALVGLTAWFVPAILFQLQRNVTVPEAQLPTAIRVLILLPPALAILYARDATNLKVNRKVLRHVWRALWRHNDEDEQRRRALNKVRTITLAFFGLTLIAIGASLWIEQFLAAAIVYWGAFLAADAFLYRYYRGPRTKMAVVIAFIVGVLGWLISVGLPERVKSVVLLALAWRAWLDSVASPWLESHFSVGLKWLPSVDLLERLYSPVFETPSFSIGSAATLLVSIDFWIALGFVVAWLSWLVQWRNGRQVVAFVVILLVAWRFFTGPFNVREVRLLHDGGDVKPVTELRDHARKWLSERLPLASSRQIGP